MPGQAGPQGLGQSLFDDNGDALFEGSKATLKSVRYIVRGHLQEMLARGVSPVHVQSLAYLFMIQIMNSFHETLGAHLREKQMKAMMAAQMPDMPPGMMEAIQQALGGGGGLMGGAGAFLGMMGGVPHFMGTPSFTLVGQGEPPDGINPTSITVDGVTIAKDSKPVTGQELYAWAKINDLTDRLNELAKQVGAKGAPMSWSDEVVHSLHTKLVAGRDDDNPKFSDN